MQTSENVDALTSLSQLNDDCLECIFERVLELPAQLQIARVCRRFCDIYIRIWTRSDYEHYRIFWLDELRDKLDHDDLKYFLHLMRSELRTLKIDECLHAFLKELEELNIKTPAVTFDGVTHLELDEFCDCYPCDDDIFTLTQLIPNLRCMMVSAPITGRHIVNFNLLEELHLYAENEKAFEIKPDFLQEICENCTQLHLLDLRSYEISYLRLTPQLLAHCQKLEILKLNLSSLKPALSAVLALPKLRRLTVLLDRVVDVSTILNVDTHDYKIYETAEFYEILATCAHKICGLAVDCYFMPLSMNWDSNLDFLKERKLRKFAFCNWPMAAHDDMLSKYAQTMSLLHTLSLRNFTQLTNDDILPFVELCTQLVHLDVSYCKNLDKTVLMDILALLKQRKRLKPLNVYYHMSGIEQEVEKTNPKFWREQSLLLKFSSGYPPDSENGLSYVDRGFEFDFES